MSSVIGAGFGGLAATKRLAKAGVDVTIVDRHNYHTFQPLLYEVATAGLNAADVAYAVRGIFRRQHNVTFRHATVTGVDWAEHTLELDRGDEQSLAFDHLVIAAGSTTTYFGIPGAAEYAFPLYSLVDAIALRNHILDRFEAADADPSLIDDGALTFVVVGGGPTGVEVSGAMSELFGMVLRKDFRSLDVGKARVILIEMADVLLQPFSDSSQRHARETLQGHGRRRPHGRSGHERHADQHHARLPARSSPRTRSCGLPACRPARSPPRSASRPAAPVASKSGATCASRGHPEAFAVGDVAAIPDGHGGVLASRSRRSRCSRDATRPTRSCARSTAAAPRPFRYFDKGTMATIGRRAAVAELPLRIRLSGTPAWLAWLGLHLVTLVGFRNRLSVFLNWAWNYVTWDRGPRLILRTDREPEASP